MITGIGAQGGAQCHRSSRGSRSAVPIETLETQGKVGRGTGFSRADFLRAVADNGFEFRVIWDI